MEYQYLTKINSPADLKRLSLAELEVLAEEMRHFMVDVVSKVGGHLGASLGAVELTLALHYVFDAPRDKLVWDVGHQAYGHKIITGRRDRFHTIRQYEGISGFPSRQESPYDEYNVAHASTSISAALGMAVARDFKREKYYVIAIVGDGGLTGGVALEGLNQAGYLKRKMLIVLNDNEMSISPNIGAIPGYLNRIVQGQTYMRFKKEVEKMVSSVPRIGPRIFKFVKQTVDAMKTFMVPGLLFHELGFDYVGPINGHSIPILVEALQRVKDSEAPTILHIVTKKGKGYKPAESSRDKYHGVTPFDPETGEMKKSPAGPPTYTQVFSRTAIELAERDQRVVAVSAAMLEGTGLQRFKERFPERCFDVGIAEQHAVTFACGLATQGFRPICAIYSTFLQRAYDQIYHDVCLMDLPITFAMDRAGVVGADGPTHHGLFDIAYLRTLPNMMLMAPKDEGELRHMIYTAVEIPHPVAVRYPRGNGVGAVLDDPLKKLEIGKAEILREGGDVALIAYGPIVSAVLNAATRLEESGIRCTVINARWAKPLDEELICALANEKHLLVTIEDAALMGGFGSAVSELLAERGLAHVRMLRLGLPDRIIPHGAPSLLYAKYGLDADGILERVKASLTDEPVHGPARVRTHS
ncbi:MAG: 1-deoxy-D-xylulose-5-phosphate synthase [Acidobacteriia bacterium]|nr:1-deoxy-D-xylulose-5-phosphate synthase [Terriglobia bacterium]